MAPELALALALALVVAGPWFPARSAEAAPASANMVQVVAHEDDDLLFMNPDLGNAVRRHTSLATVYLTAGEGYLRGPAAAEYVAKRQAGVKLAYARMAGVPCDGDASACWTGHEVSLAGRSVQRFDLNADSSIRLYFLNLPENADAGRPHLKDLWDGTATATTSLTPAGATVPEQTYTKHDVVDVVAEVLRVQSATLVRMQDPAPDPTLYTPLPLHDHVDHITAAWFADAAVDRYASTVDGRVLSEHYRDYNISDTPAVLSSDETAEKFATFSAYAAEDTVMPAADRARTACSTIRGSRYQCYPSRVRLRNPRSTQWVTSDASGALHAFVVEGGRLYEWSETADKVWTGPVSLGNNGWPLAAGICVARDRDGRIGVFGQRSDTGEIVSASPGDGGDWTWVSHGSPNAVGTAPLTNDALQVSMPAVASNGDGGLQIFVRNRGGGVSTSRQLSPGGGWSRWTDLGGSRIQGAPAAVTTQDGRIELFALSGNGSRFSVRHWYQPAAGQALRSDPSFPPVSPVSDLGVGVDADGRIELAYRRLDSPEPMTGPAHSYTVSLSQTQADGGWAPEAGALGGGPDQGGYGAPAVATAGDRSTVTVVRNRAGGVSVSVRTDPGGPSGGWTDLGGSVVGSPAVGIDRDGLADIVAIGTDGRLYDTRQVSAGGAFGPWNRAGS